MKTRRLHELDLARIATMPRDRRRTCLEQLHDGFPPHTYNPLRHCFPDLLDEQYSLLGQSKPTPWAVIERALNKTCRSAGELNANLRVARGLHDWITSNGTTGRKERFFPLSMEAGARVTYWVPFILNIGGRPTVPFIDPRRSRELTMGGRRFVFSMMHERIRAGNPDNASVQFVVLQFANTNCDVRSVILHPDDGIELFSFEQLDRMVTETYELWREVCEERESATRRAAAGLVGSLL